MKIEIETVEENLATEFVPTEEMFVTDFLMVKSDLQGMAFKFANGDPSIAEEYLSKVLVRLWKGYFSRFDGKDFNSWSKRVAYNTMVNAWRSRKRHLQTFAYQPEPLSGEGGRDDDNLFKSELSGNAAKFGIQWENRTPNPEELVEAKQQYLKLRRIIDETLHAYPQRRDLVIGCDMYDRQYSEMADELGMKIGTVMSALHRARKQVKARLIELGITP